MSSHFTRAHCAFFASPLFAEVGRTIADIGVKYADPLAMQTTLRALFPDVDRALLAAAQSQCALRARASRLRLPDGALLTAAGLEQASSAAAAALHARLLRPALAEADGRAAADLCSGIGADALRLREIAPLTVCVERDPVTAAMLRHNLSLPVHADPPAGDALVLRGDARSWVRALRTGRVAAVFADPSRRVDGRRRIALEDYDPPVDALADALPRLPLLVKVAPAAEVPDNWARVCVAVGEHCPELLLARGFDLPRVCALDAEDGARWTPPAAPPAADALHPMRDPTHLIEPHPAIIRTGALAAYFYAIGAAPLDPHIAYGLLADAPPPGRWHRSFRILSLLPYNRKALVREARARGFGRAGTEIKKRGFPLLPEEVRRMLPAGGGRRGVLLLARRGDAHVMVFAERCDRP